MNEPRDCGTEFRFADEFRTMLTVAMRGGDDEVEILWPKTNTKHDGRTVLVRTRDTSGEHLMELTCRYFAETDG